MDTRPRLILQKHRMDIWLERSALFALMLLWAFTIYAFKQLPEIVPIHFDGAGKPDGYGTKWTMFILPLITTALFFGITAINKHPHIFNYTTTITEENAEQQYRMATRLLRFTNLGVVLIFLAIEFSTYRTGLGKSDGLEPWFFPMVIVLSLAAAIVPLVMAAKNHED